MFDIGFWELLIIGTVTLLVVGPDRLPGLATFVGQWVGRARRFANHMRSEIQQELEAEHLKNLVDEQKQELQSLRREVEGVRDETETAARDIERSARGETGTVARGASEPEGTSTAGQQPGQAAAGDGAASAPPVPDGEASEPSAAQSSANKPAAKSASKKGAAKKAASKKKTSAKKTAAKKKAAANKTSATTSATAGGNAGTDAASAEPPRGGDET